MVFCDRLLGFESYKFSRIDSVTNVLLRFIKNIEHKEMANFYLLHGILILSLRLVGIVTGPRYSLLCFKLVKNVSFIRD